MLQQPARTLPSEQVIGATCSRLQILGCEQHSSTPMGVEPDNGKGGVPSPPGIVGSVPVATSPSRHKRRCRYQRVAHRLLLNIRLKQPVLSILSGIVAESLSKFCANETGEARLYYWRRGFGRAGSGLLLNNQRSTSAPESGRDPLPKTAYPSTSSYGSTRRGYALLVRGSSARCTAAFAQRFAPQYKSTTCCGNASHAISTPTRTVPNNAITIPARRRISFFTAISG